MKFTVADLLDQLPGHEALPLTKLEKALGLLHQQLAAVEARLADAAIYEAARKDELREQLAEQARLKIREAELEEVWMAALEQLEALEQQLAQAD